MFSLMADLVLQAWKAEGEKRLAEVFETEYIMKEDYNLWNYSCFKSPGLVPQNNSIERSNLDMKGSRCISAIINTRVTVGDALHVEFPKLIYTNSSERVGAKMDYAILDASKCIDSACIETFRKLKEHNDTKAYKDGFLVNTSGFEGVPIDSQRINRYEMALLGHFQGTYQERHLLHDYVYGLCHVTHTTLVTGEFCFVGSCEEFFKTTCCPHAVYFQHKEILPALSFKIPTKKSGRTKAIKKGKALSRATTSTGIVTSLYSPLQVVESNDRNELVSWLSDSPTVNSNKVFNIDGERREYLHRFCEQLNNTAKGEGNFLLHSDFRNETEGECLRVTILRSIESAFVHPQTAEPAASK
jgi:hypothetical protein